MLSSVFVSGRLGEAVGKDVRLVEVDRVLSGAGGKFKVDAFPVRCLLGKSTLFFKAKEGSLIVLKGRLERDQDLGIVIVDEIDEIFPAKEARG